MCKELVVQRDGAEIPLAICKGRWAPNFTLDGGVQHLPHRRSSTRSVAFRSGTLGLTTPILGTRAGSAPAAKGESGKRHWIISLGSLPSAPASASKRGSSFEGTEVGRAPPETPQLPARIAPGNRVLQKLSSAGEIESLKTVSISHYGLY